MPKEGKQKMKGAWRTTWKNTGKIHQKYVEENKRKQWVDKCWRWCGNETYQRRNRSSIDDANADDDVDDEQDKTTGSR